MTIEESKQLLELGFRIKEAEDRSAQWYELELKHLVIRDLQITCDEHSINVLGKEAPGWSNTILMLRELPFSIDNLTEVLRSLGEI
jgi:hypothetical protein